MGGHRVYVAIVTDVFIVVSAAELSLNPRLGNQLGGTGVLVTGLCTQPGDIFSCTFDGRPTLGSLVDGNTVLCLTPVMTTPGSVDVLLRRRRTVDGRIELVSVSSTFTTCKQKHFLA